MSETNQDLVSIRREKRQMSPSQIIENNEIIELCKYQPNLLAISDIDDKDQRWKSDLVSFLASPNVRDENPESIIHAYAKLCEVTYPVTGASIIASRNARHVLLMLFVGAILSICILGQLSVSFASNSSRDDLYPWLWEFFYYFGLYLYPVIAGLLWGGLGSCVYLLKRVNDLARSREFDPDLYKGVWVRMVLGGTLGWVVVNIFDLESADLGGISIPAIAFITGLSVKVVYGALEKLVQTLEQKMNLGSIRHSVQKPITLKNQLEQTLLEIDGNSEKELSYQIRELLKLINKRSDPL